MARHALLIGMSEFADKRLARLNAPTNDILALRGLLQDNARGGFDSVALSLNDDFVAMRDHLSRFFHDRAPDDLLLLYYSGHGILGRGNRLYLATTGSNLDVPRNRSIAAQEIREFIEECRAERQIVILDCCHSGAFAEHAKAAVPPPAVTAETFARADAGLYVLTAADALQFAYDGADLRLGDAAANSLSQFTSWLVEGLEKGEAAPDDEQITIDALYRYLFRRARTAGAAATPQRFVQGGVGDLVISHNPLAGAARIDPAIAAALESADRLTRLGAVTDLALQIREGTPAAARPARLALERHLPHERDYAVRAVITTAVQEAALGQAEEAQQRVEIVRPAEEEKPRAPAARPAEGEKRQAEPLPKMEKRRGEAQERWAGVLRGHQGPVCSVAGLPDGWRALSASDDKTIRLWDLKSGAEVRRFEGHEGAVKSVAVLPDGRRAVSGADDGTMRLWDLETGAELRRLRHPKAGSGFEVLPAEVRSVAVLPDGRRALSGCDDRMRLWDLELGAELRQFACPAKGITNRLFKVSFESFATVAALPDGRRALSGTSDGTMRLWDLETEAELRQFIVDVGIGKWLGAAEWHVVPISDRHRALTCRGGPARLWDLDTGSELGRFGKDICVIAALQDGRRALSGSGLRGISGSRDFVLRLWDLASGAELGRLEGHTDTVGAISVLPDGRRALSGSDDGTVRLWDIETLIGASPDGSHAM